MAQPLASSRRRRLGIIGLILLSLFVLPSLSASVDDQRFQAYIERHANGWIDWKNGLIYGIGIGDVKKNRNNKPLAQGVAGVLASGNIVKLAAGLYLDDARTLKSLGGGRIVIKLKAFIRDRIYSKTYHENNGNPYYEVVKVAEMKGISGLTARLLDTLEKDGTWRDLPIPSAEDRAAAAAGDAEGPWLVLDARNLPNGERVQPALLPKIKSETGEDVYDVTRVEKAALINRGMMSYVVSDVPAADLRADARILDRILAAAGVLGPAEAVAATREGSLSEIPMFGGRQAPAPPPRRRPRRKRGRYIVADVKQVQGLAKTNLVISARDALELKDEDASSRILRKCRVIVVVSSPVGGVEGRLPLLFAGGRNPRPES